MVAGAPLSGKDAFDAGLSPFEDRGPGYHFAILSRHHTATLKLQHFPIICLRLKVATLPVTSCSGRTESTALGGT
jgi:hypothetical protein